MKKGLILILSIVMVVCVSISVTLAYLFVETDTIVNTFVYGDINITLEESDDLDFKMIPGNKIAKDPKVTVKAGSEGCWLFVELTKSDNYGTYLEDYAVREGWTRLKDGVYYREAKAGDEFYVLANGEAEYANGYVKVKESVTKAQMEAIKTSGMPTLTVKAYAVQKANVKTAADAWALVATKGVPTT